MKVIKVGLNPEYILTIFNIKITNTFLTSIIVTLILAFISIFFYIKKNKKKNIIVSTIKILIFELLIFTDMVTKNRKLSKKILPLISTFFIFIITANLLTLIPGFLGTFFMSINSEQISILRSPNSDLTTTLALAIISVFSIQIFSFQALGIKNYIFRFVNFANPIKFIIGFFELISELVKVFSFSFRLFGNIFAGEVLLLVIAFIFPYIIPLPFMILEVFVGIIQAFIFSMLTLTFIKTSTIYSIDKKTNN